MSYFEKVNFKNDDDAVNTVANRLATGQSLVPTLLQFNDYVKKGSGSESEQIRHANHLTKMLEDRGLLFSTLIEESKCSDMKHTQKNRQELQEDGPMDKALMKSLDAHYLEIAEHNYGNSTDSLVCIKDSFAQSREKYSDEQDLYRFSGTAPFGQGTDEQHAGSNTQRLSSDDYAQRIKELETRLAIQTEKLARLTAPTAPESNGEHWIFDQAGNGQLVGPNGERQYNLINGQKVWIDQNKLPERQCCLSGNCSSCRPRTFNRDQITEQSKSIYLMPIRQCCGDGSCAGCRLTSVDSYSSSGRENVEAIASCGNGRCGGCGSCRPKRRHHR